MKIVRGLSASATLTEATMLSLHEVLSLNAGYLVHVQARLANTVLKDEESARDNPVLACNFATYSPIINFSQSQTQQ